MTNVLKEHIILRYNSGWSEKEIAKVYGLTEDQVISFILSIA